VPKQSKPPLTELVVMSRPASIGQTTPGHIMIAVSRAGIGEQAWGFYPSGIRDEIQVGGWQRYTNSSVIRITETQYWHLLAAIGEYKKGHSYHLFSSNCRHFVVTVLRQAGIAVTEETLWPNDQGKMYMKRYGEGWGRCLSADAE
jgi:hypothetical protein